MLFVLCNLVSRGPSFFLSLRKKSKDIVHLRSTKPPSVRSALFDKDMQITQPDYQHPRFQSASDLMSEKNHLPKARLSKSSRMVFSFDKRAVARFINSEIFTYNHTWCYIPSDVPSDWKLAKPFGNFVKLRHMLLKALRSRYWMTYTCCVDWFCNVTLYEMLQGFTVSTSLGGWFHKERV